MPCSYGVRPPTSDGAPGAIWVVDVFQHLLEAPVDLGGGGPAPLQRLHGVSPRQILATSPPLDFHVTSAAASANGHQLLLAGTSIEVRRARAGAAAAAAAGRGVAV